MPTAVKLELGVAQPTQAFRFRIYSAEVPRTLHELDAALTRLGIPFHIKSLGLSNVIMGLIRTARFRLLLSKAAAERVTKVLRVIGAA